MCPGRPPPRAPSRGGCRHPAVLLRVPADADPVAADGRRAGIGGSAGDDSRRHALLLVSRDLAEPERAPSRAHQPMRIAAVFFACGIIASYVSVNRHALATLQQDGVDVGMIMLAGWLGTLLLTSDGVSSTGAAANAAPPGRHVRHGGGHHRHRAVLHRLQRGELCDHPRAAAAGPLQRPAVARRPQAAVVDRARPDRVRRRAGGDPADRGAPRAIRAAGTATAALDAGRPHRGRHSAHPVQDRVHRAGDGRPRAAALLEPQGALDRGRWPAAQGWWPPTPRSRPCSAR